jgi:CheY-like chemotaxis protein
MVHGFVHQSGGTLRLLTTPGSGTRVQLYFPRALTSAPNATVAPAPEPDHAPVAPHVLVVDDDEAVRRMLTRVLELRGMAVESAPDALTAMQRLREQPFDAVLSDVLMPGGLDGLDLARWARQRNLPVLLLSGFVGGELPQDLLDDPGVRFLRKPVDSTVLAKDLHDLVAMADVGRGSVVPP